MWAGLRTEYVSLILLLPGQAYLQDAPADDRSFRPSISRVNKRLTAWVNFGTSTCGNSPQIVLILPDPFASRHLPWLAVSHPSLTVVGRRKDYDSASLNLPVLKVFDANILTCTGLHYLLHCLVTLAIVSRVPYKHSRRLGSGSVTF